MTGGWLLTVGSRHSPNPPQYQVAAHAPLPSRCTNLPLQQTALEPRWGLFLKFLEGSFHGENTFSLFLRADKKQGNDPSGVRGHGAPCAFALSSTKCNVVVFFKYQWGIATTKWSVDYLHSLLDFKNIFLKNLIRSLSDTRRLQSPAAVCLLSNDGGLTENFCEKLLHLKVAELDYFQLYVYHLLANFLLTLRIISTISRK